MTIVEPKTSVLITGWESITMAEAESFPFMGVSGILELILALIGLWMVLSGFGVEQAII